MQGSSVLCSLLPGVCSPGQGSSSFQSAPFTVRACVGPDWSLFQADSLSGHPGTGLVTVSGLLFWGTLRLLVIQMFTGHNSDITDTASLSSATELHVTQQPHLPRL